MNSKPMTMTDLISVLLIFAVMVTVDGSPLIDSCWMTGSRQPTISQKAITENCATGGEPQRILATGGYLTVISEERVCSYEVKSDRCVCGEYQNSQTIMGSSAYNKTAVIISFIDGQVVLQDITTLATLKAFTVPPANYFMSDITDGSIHLYHNTPTGVVVFDVYSQQYLTANYTCNQIVKSDWLESPIRQVGIQQEATLYQYSLLLQFTTSDVRLRRELVTDMHQVVSLVANAVYGSASCMGLCDMTTSNSTWIIRNCYNCDGSEWSSSRGVTTLSAQYYSFQISVQTALELDEVLLTLNDGGFKMIFSTWGYLEAVTSVPQNTNTDTLEHITTRSATKDETEKIVGIIVASTSAVVVLSVGVWCYMTRTDDYILDNEKKKQDPDKADEPLQTEADSLAKETTSTTRPSETYFIEGDDPVLELDPVRDEEEEEPHQSI